MNGGANGESEEEAGDISGAEVATYGLVWPHTAGSGGRPNSARRIVNGELLVRPPKLVG